MATGKPIKPVGKLVKPGNHFYTVGVFGLNTGKPVKSVGIPVGTVYTCDFEFGFEFNQFPPVSDQTGPVNRYRRAAV